MRRRGVTLAELLVAMSILGLLLGAVFSLFGLGTDAFRISLLRQDLQTTARFILTRLEQEIRVTHLESMSVADTRSVGTSRRHMLCMSSLSDWNDLTLYDVNSGMPRWNRYLLYYATLEVPLGGLIRLELEAPASGPWSAFKALVPPSSGLPASPFAGAKITRGQILTAEVLEFGVTPADKALHCTLKLRRQDTATMGGQKRRDEVFQLDIEARPRNPLS